jgi:pimeloyl-ACP methyl ester carboxylesterase
MATRFSLPGSEKALFDRTELVRRIALAREPLAGHEDAERPSIWRLLAEASHILEPLKRPFRKIAVGSGARPRTVMLLPGFATHPVRMRYMAQQLEKAGHTVKRWGLGFNLGPTAENVGQLEARLLEISERYGDRVVLVGWSLGGLFARELAHRHPDRVAKVITMGSPFSGNPRSNNAWRIYQFVAGHRVDQTPVEREIASKPPVETVAFWSARDGIVSPRSSRGRSGERDRAVALRCNHLGFSSSKECIEAVLRELDDA